MKIKRTVVAAAGVMALALAGCASTNTEAPEGGGGSDTVTTLSFAHWIPGETPQTKQYEHIAELVKERTDGELVIELFPGGQLGDQRDTLEGLQAGTIDMSKADDGYLVNYIKDYSVLSLPFMFENYDHLAAVLDSDIIADLDARLLEKSGLRTLGWSFTGFRQFYLDESVQELDDFNGKNIRAPEIDVYIKTIESLGANPTPTPWGEVYLGLETGLVQGFESSPADAVAISADEVIKNVLVTNHIQASAAIVISEKAWERLSAEQQKILQEVVTETTKEQRNAQQAADDEAIQSMADQGIEVAPYPKPEELVKAVQPVWDEYRSDPEMADLIDKISNFEY